MGTHLPNKLENLTLILSIHKIARCDCVQLVRDSSQTSETQIQQKNWSQKLKWKTPHLFQSLTSTSMGSTCTRTHTYMHTVHIQTYIKEQLYMESDFKGKIIREKRRNRPILLEKAALPYQSGLFI